LPGSLTYFNSFLPESFIDYEYNLRNLLSSVTSDAPPPVATYTYNARNQIAATVVENGLFAASRSYDAAGRLTGVTNGTLGYTGYTLSPDGRRTGINRNGQAETYGYDNARQVTSAAYPDLTTTYFFTNGWNVELEHNGSTYTRRNTWGLDLSQSPHGAGGVGGLVMVETLPGGAAAPIPHFPTYDGNGNITAWVNVSGTVIARQRYDAYGSIIDQTGTPPSNYGFSTKPQDQVTGLLYYGYRYYDPLTGRWPSRDPIEERGGVNLYGFVGNNGVNKWDRLGLMEVPIGWKCTYKYSTSCGCCGDDNACGTVDTTGEGISPGKIENGIATPGTKEDAILDAYKNSVIDAEEKCFNKTCPKKAESKCSQKGSDVDVKNADCVPLYLV